jgi:indole-3-acetate monooxygenase
MQEQDSLRHQLLAEVASIAPILTDRAAESEKLGHLDDVTWDALRNTHLLSFLCPRELGGDEADPLVEFEVIEALARIDASAAWVVGNLALASAYVAALLPTDVLPIISSSNRVRNTA